MIDSKLNKAEQAEADRILNGGKVVAPAVLPKPAIKIDKKAEDGKTQKVK